MFSGTPCFYTINVHSAHTGSLNSRENRIRELPVNVTVCLCGILYRLDMCQDIVEPTQLY